MKTNHTPQSKPQGTHKIASIFMLVAAFCFAGIASAAAIDNTGELIWRAARQDPFDPIVFNQKLASLNATINTPDAWHLGNWTALHWAIMVDDPRAVANLLTQQDINLELTDSEGNTPLLFGDGGNTPLILAIKMKNLAIVNSLIARGANVDTPNHNQIDNTPLHYAAAHFATDSNAPFIEIAQALIAANANVNSQNRMGYTPLHKAALMGNLAICKLLIDGGANRDITTLSGITTPLSLAQDVLKQVSGGYNTYHDPAEVKQITLAQLKANLKEVIDFLTPPVASDQSNQPGAQFDDQPAAQLDD